jgi:hypothetical protein
MSEIRLEATETVIVETPYGKIRITVDDVVYGPRIKINVSDRGRRIYWQTKAYNAIDLVLPERSIK